MTNLFFVGKTPQFLTGSGDTSVRMWNAENGGTVVLGGIDQMTETRSDSKVPVIGDIPVVGNLFKSTQRQNSKTELLVFITPRLVQDRVGQR